MPHRLAETTFVSPHEVDCGIDASEIQARIEQRNLELYEAVLEHTDWSDPTRADQAGAALRDDFLRRFSTPPPATGLQSVAHEVLVHNPWFWGWRHPKSRWSMVAILIWLACFALWMTVGWWALLPVGLVVLAGLYAESKSSRRGRRQHCPRCSYDLDGLASAIPIEAIGIHLGPRRCPECGEPWPMVP